MSTMRQIVTRYCALKENTPSRRMAEILRANRHLPEIAEALAKDAPRKKAE